ncbi:NUDIX domain-containing protein [Sulfitobacter sp. PR48]|uniref:NUDIX domain-containing protein n=1 Tax=Sulfitobacter sp. PR48 TaxID=3028383 RepID=UPI00237AA3E8|nr:NUDIX domain-containing protein [Sulfitobacter sp. PR48]MDD9721796.1 NUDIX domain-containing protein [Sulfitobacter sp. PR48]
MERRIEISQRKTVFQRFIFRIDELQLRHELYNGSMGAQITRLVLERGDSVCVLPHDPVARVVLLCEQFRAPTAANGPGWLAEIPAGVLEEGESSEDCARRETLEETGHEIDALTRIATVYPSPGGSSERIHVFYGQIALRLDAPDTAGVANEGEDIRIFRVPAEDALRRLHAGEIQDAKTVIALQWLELAMLRADVPGSPALR